MTLVRQLITRVDDELHAKLRGRANAEGRSVNSLVVDILTAETSGATRKATAFRRRARAAGRLVVPPRPAGAPSRETVEKVTRGAGSAVSDALAAERAQR